MITRCFVIGASVVCAGISFLCAVRKVKTSREDRGSINKKSELKPGNEDKTIAAPASKEHIQMEKDLKIDTVTLKQSDTGKNSQAAINNDIHQNSPYNADSVSSLLLTANVVSKRLGKSPADVPSSVESEEIQCHPVTPVDPIAELPVLSVVFKTLPVPETSIAAPEVSISTLESPNVEPDTQEEKESDTQEEKESNLPDDSPAEFLLPEIEQQENPSIKLIYPCKEGQWSSSANTKSELKPVNEDYTITAPASTEHIQMEQDLKLDTVTPMQLKELKGMPDLTEDRIQKKTHGIIDEFLSNGDLQDAVESVKEHMHKMTIVPFIDNALNIIIERKPSARTEFGKLLRELLSKQLISRDGLIEGFRMILEGASDIIVDVPQLFENLAQTLQPVLEHDGQFLYVVKDMEQLVSADITTRGRLVAAVLAEIAKSKDKETAARVWHTSGLTWESFGAKTSDNVEQLISSKNLDFTKNSPGSLPQA